MKWNGGVSFPIESGHGCLGCSEPNFWDKGSFYKPLPMPLADNAPIIAAAALGGIAVGTVAAIVSRKHQNSISEEK